MHAQVDTVKLPSMPGTQPWWRRTLEGAMEFDPKITLGEIMGVIALAGGVTFWAISSAGTAKTAADAAQRASDGVASLRADMNDQFRGVKADTAQQFQQVRSDIANIPDMHAEMTQLEKRQDSADARIEALSKRIDLMQRDVIQERADLDNIVRASQAPQKH